MSKNQEKFSKGSIHKAMRGEFDFDVKKVMQEGWALTQKDKLAMLQGIGVIFVIALMVMGIAQEISHQKGIDIQEPGFRMGTEVVLMILVAPFAAALMMMGVNASIGGKNKGSHVFRFVHRTISIVVASVLISALVQIGMLLLFLPGLYLIVATGFTIPLILDKGILPSRAIMISIKVVNFQWLKFVKLYLLFFLLLLLVAATFGVAMIWVAPFYYNVKGLLYRDIFGVGVEHQVFYPAGVSSNDRVMSDNKGEQSAGSRATGDEPDGSKHRDPSVTGKHEKDGFFDA